MKIFGFFLLWCGFLLNLQAEDTGVVAQVQRILNPQSRFNLYERQSDGSFDMRPLTCRYVVGTNSQTFFIHGLKESYDLAIVIDRNGEPQARVELVGEQGKGVALQVIHKAGKFDKSDQSLESLLKAGAGVPQSLAFGVFFDGTSTNFGSDTAEYTLAFRRETDGPIVVVHCRHDLRGSPLEAPRQAAADVAAGGLLAGLETLSFAAYGWGGGSGEARTQLLAVTQPMIDKTILEMEKLTHYTGNASPMVKARATSALVDTKVIAEMLRKWRDQTMAGKNLDSSDQKRVDKILTMWAESGIPFSSPYNSSEPWSD